MDEAWAYGAMAWRLTAVGVGASPAGVSQAVAMQMGPARPTLPLTRPGHGSQAAHAGRYGWLRKPQPPSCQPPSCTHLDALDLLLRPQQLVLQVLLLLLDVLLLHGGRRRQRALLIAAIRHEGNHASPVPLPTCRLPICCLPGSPGTPAAAAASSAWSTGPRSCRCCGRNKRRGQRAGQQATAAEQRSEGGRPPARLRRLPRPWITCVGWWGAAPGPTQRVQPHLVSATSIASAFGPAGTSRAACTAAAALIVRRGCPLRSLLPACGLAARCLRPVGGAGSLPGYGDSKLMAEGPEDRPNGRRRSASSSAVARCPTARIELAIPAPLCLPHAAAWHINCLAQLLWRRLLKTLKRSPHGATCARCHAPTTLQRLATAIPRRCRAPLPLRCACMK